MSKERTLTVIDKEIAREDELLHEAAQKAEEHRIKLEALRDERDDVRVAGFDQDLVKLAIEKGINPRNFETENELRAAFQN